MTKEQLHRPARQQIDEWWPGDAPRVIEVWQSPQTQAAIAAYLEGLRQRSAARRSTS
jgi:hypothetical protein